MAWYDALLGFPGAVVEVAGKLKDVLVEVWDDVDLTKLGEAIAKDLAGGGGINTAAYLAPLLKQNGVSPDKLAKALAAVGWSAGGSAVSKATGSSGERFIAALAGTWAPVPTADVSVQQRATYTAILNNVATWKAGGWNWTDGTLHVYRHGGTGRLLFVFTHANVADGGAFAVVAKLGKKLVHASLRESDYNMRYEGDIGTTSQGTQYVRWLAETMAKRVTDEAVAAGAAPGTKDEDGPKSNGSKAKQTKAAAPVLGLGLLAALIALK